MGLFEFYTVLLSIVISIGLASLLGTAMRLIQDADRVTFSAIHALWAVAIFLQQLGFWLKSWDYHALTDLTPVIFFTPLSLAILAYACSALVTPHIPEHGPIDLKAFHARQSPRYAVAMAAYLLMAIVQAIMMDPMTADLQIDGLVMGLMAAVILVSVRWSRIAWLQVLTPCLIMLAQLRFIIDRLIA